MNTNSNRVPILQLLTISLAADLLTWYFLEDQWPQPTLVFWYSLIFSQISLSAIWVGLGESHFAWRLLLMPVVTIAASFALSLVSYNWRWPIAVGSQILTVACPLWITRWAGVRLASPYSTAESVIGLQSMQFRLWHLWAGMTGIGVVLGVSRAWPWPTTWQLFDRKALMLAGCFAFVALVGLWTALGTGRLPLRIIALILASLGAGAALSLQAGGSPDSYGVVELTLMQMILLAASLGVFRYCGYRLEWRRGTNRSIRA